MQNLINLDEKIFSWFNSMIEKSPIFDSIIKFSSVYLIYFVPVALLFFWFWKKNEKNQLFLLNLTITSVISWQVIARIIGMIINRPRPENFAGTKELLFHPPTYSFPSDHALFLAFIAAFLFINGYKKIGWMALTITLIISISRIIIGFHWPGDILVGWILGIALAYFFYQIRKPMEEYIVKPLISIARKIGLA